MSSSLLGRLQSSDGPARPVPRQDPSKPSIAFQLAIIPTYHDSQTGLPTTPTAGPTRVAPRQPSSTERPSVDAGAFRAVTCTIGRRTRPKTKSLPWSTRASRRCQHRLGGLLAGHSLRAGLPTAPYRRASGRSKSGARPATRATPCSLDTSATASCSSTTRPGHCSEAARR